MIPALFTIILINFLIIHISPGNPALYMAGMEAPYEYIEAMEAKWGLNLPIHEQFQIYFMNLIRGDFGDSYRFGQSVLSVILEYLPATILLTFTSLFLSLFLGVILGVFSSRKPFSQSDNILSILSLIFYSLPVFWTGIMFILTFGLRLRWFPIQGMHTLKGSFTGFAWTLDFLWHLVLPVATLSLVQLAIYYRLTRASMLEELRRDYIITARSKGLDDRGVLFGHALQNGLIPLITIVGMRMRFVFTGALLTETVFAWPGIGRLMYQGILARDYPLLMGIFLIASIITLISNFLVDVLYAVIDPRIRYN